MDQAIFIWTEHKYISNDKGNLIISPKKKHSLSSNLHMVYM